MSSTQRAWLVHCNDPRGNLAACEISTDNAEVTIAAPPQADLFTLEHAQIGAFTSALGQAIAVAERDMAKP